MMVMGELFKGLEAEGKKQEMECTKEDIISVH